MPNGITFEDTFESVLQKLDIRFDPETAFTGDKGIVLSKDGSLTITLTNETPLPGTDIISYDYELTYTENDTHIYEDGVESTITRCIVMSFTGDDHTLGDFEMSVSETYPLSQGE